MSRVIRRERMSLPPANSYPFPSFLLELVAMMLDADPLNRPDIHMICQLVEDELSPPPRIMIETTDQHPTSETRITSVDHELVRQLAKELVEKELERMGRPTM